MKKNIIIVLLISIVILLCCCNKKQDNTTDDTVDTFTDALSEEITSDELSSEETLTVPETTTTQQDTPVKPPESVLEQLTQTLSEEEIEKYLKTISEVSLKEGKAPAKYLENIVFVGDSTTYGLYAYGYLDRSQIWVPKNGTLALFLATTEPLFDSTDGSELTLYEMSLKHKPKYMVITLGVNGVSFLAEEYFKGYYESVINEVKRASPNTKIILQSIYPLCSNYDTSNGINNIVIFKGNGMIAEIAKKYKLPYLNTASEFVDGTGYRPIEYTNGDGLHLSPAGYEFILKYIETHPYK